MARVAHTLLFPSHAEMNLNPAAGSRKTRRASRLNGTRQCSGVPRMQKWVAIRVFRRLLGDLVFRALPCTEGFWGGFWER